MKRKIGLLFLIMTWVSLSAFGQARPKKNEPASDVVQINFHYTYFTPFADLADRFGNFSGIGIGGSYRMLKGWNVGAWITPMWGGDVRNANLFDSMVGPTGELIDNNGNVAVVIAFMRGMQIQGHIGKLFKISKKHPHTGIMYQLGGGFMQHKIKFQHTINVLPQLENDMYKGYDRLSNGFQLTQYLGVQFSSRRKSMHFFLGAELGTLYSVNRRGYNYDTRQYDTGQRRDVTLGLKAGAFIPIYILKKGMSEDGEDFYN